jgi:hypothetical protein
MNEDTHIEADITVIGYKCVAWTWEDLDMFTDDFVSI